MITYPILEKNATIGVTAPSSGIPVDMHDLLKQASNRLKSKGYAFVLGETAWTQEKAKSAPASKRADEFTTMMNDDQVDLVIPPWGGELLIEILEYLDFDKIKAKWILGYSDLSVLLLAITLKTGIATAHGTNLIDLRGEYSDSTTAMWESVLATQTGDSILQHSSTHFQKVWNHSAPTPCVFHLTEPTQWKVLSHTHASLKGRLLGGCIDVIRHLIGTPYGNVTRFQKHFVNHEPILWYLENCELSTTDLRRSLVQMKLAGWFDHCSGVMFGRSSANQPVDGYTVEDVYRELSDELNIPIVYDIDCGHVPPQLTMINGAYAEVEVTRGQGSLLQIFKP